MDFDARYICCDDPERTLTPTTATNKIIGAAAGSGRVKAVCKAGPTIYAFVEMLTLYHNDMSVCAAKVRTALAAKKLDWNGVHFDLRHLFAVA